MGHLTDGGDDFQLDSCGPTKGVAPDDDDGELHFDAGAWADQLWQEIERVRAFNDLPAFRVDYTAAVTEETSRLADRVFSDLRGAGLLHGYKLRDKRRALGGVVHALRLAGYFAGCVMYSRRHDRGFSRLRLDVIDAVVEGGLAREVRSRRGYSPHQSRLLPAEGLGGGLVDPLSLEPQGGPLVRVYRRQGRRRVPVPFDHEGPVAVGVRQRLEVINAVLAGTAVTSRRYDPWEDCLGAPRLLRPSYYAVFTDSLGLHGRLYDGKFGCQSLRKLERQAVLFVGAPSCWLDFQGLHPRLCYHLEGVDYPGDPYALWGEATTPPMRTMAKLLVNAMINADSDRAAVSACNRKMSPFTGATGSDGRPRRKAGKAGRQARMLRAARERTGLTFAGMVPLVRRRHPRIGHYFGTGAGLRLMRIDSAIALDVMHHFAAKGVPCLGVHDEFGVPHPSGAELRQVMAGAYRTRVGCEPVITPP